MNGLNRVSLIGNVGQDPTIKELENKNRVANFSLATTVNYKDGSGETQQDTEWHNIVCWNQLATIVETYVSKGDAIYVEGKIRYRKYENNDGEKKYFTEIIAQEVRVFHPKNPNKNGTNKTSNATTK